MSGLGNDSADPGEEVSTEIEVSSGTGQDLLGEFQFLVKYDPSYEIVWCSMAYFARLKLIRISMTSENTYVLQLSNTFLFKQNIQIHIFCQNFIIIF